MKNKAAYAGITSGLPTIRELTNLGQRCAITSGLPARDTLGGASPDRVDLVGIPKPGDKRVAEPQRLEN